MTEQDREVNRDLFSLAGSTRMVRDDRFKLIYPLRSEESWLFDLAADPGEPRDVLAEQPDEAAALRRALFQWIEGRVGTSESLEKTDELERRLKAVGYL